MCVWAFGGYSYTALQALNSPDSPQWSVYSLGYYGEWKLGHNANVTKFGMSENNSRNLKLTWHSKNPRTKESWEELLRVGDKVPLLFKFPFSLKKQIKGTEYRKPVRPFWLCKGHTNLCSNWWFINLRNIFQGFWLMANRKKQTPSR